MKKIEDIILEKDVNREKFVKKYTYSISSNYSTSDKTYKEEKFPDTKNSCPVSPGDRIWAYSKAFKVWLKAIVIEEKGESDQLSVYAADYPCLNRNRTLTQAERENKELAKFLCQIWQVKMPEGTPHPVFKGVIEPLDLKTEDTNDTFFNYD